MPRFKKASKKKEKKTLAKDYSASYNSYKEFEGHRYSGMKIGRRHKWYYDQGEWHDKKITPEEWEIDYTVTKRRAGKAPEGSGAAVGTQYHWYIIAHQIVTKLDANDYSTSLNGLKFKLAHKRSGKETWSASSKSQRKKMIKILQRLITDLEQLNKDEEKKVVPLRPAARKKTVLKKKEKKVA